MIRQSLAAMLCAVGAFASGCSSMSPGLVKPRPDAVYTGKGTWWWPGKSEEDGTSSEPSGGNVSRLPAEKVAK
jgi:hypothetical protein